MLLTETDVQISLKKIINQVNLIKNSIKNDKKLFQNIAI